MGPDVQKLKVVITGATGFVGEGVLFECLDHPAIEQVLLVSRKTYKREKPKIEQCIVPDFLDLDGFSNELTGYDACFYCAGISSVGVSESEYSRVTYDTTIHFAEKLAGLNPQMIFCHVSGRNATDKGRQMWQRIKGKTEAALMSVGFRKVYNFRPALMKPTPGQQNVSALYRVITALYPLLRVLLPNQVSTMGEVGLAMINSVLKGYPKEVLEVADIKSLAKV